MFWILWSSQRMTERMEPEDDRKQILEGEAKEVSEKLVDLLKSDIL